MPEVTTDVEVTVDVEVWCGGCGDGLCNQTDSGNRHRRGNHFTVHPCERCLQNAHDEGYLKGYDARDEEASDE